MDDVLSYPAASNCSGVKKVTDSFPWRKRSQYCVMESAPGNLQA